MDHQLMEMIRDRFDSLDTKLDQTMDTFKAHAEYDQRYWKRLDNQEAQLNLLQKIFWGAATVIGSFITWAGLKH